MPYPKNLKLINQILLLGCAIQFICVSASLATDKTYQILDYGAKGDGSTLNTEAIQRAIDECHANGGGRVLFPEGRFLTGTVQIKDNVTLYLEQGSVLLGSTDLKDYKNVDPFVEGLGIEVGWALVVAVDSKNIGIEGQGSIDGQGVALKERHIQTDLRPEGERWGKRPFLLRVIRCSEVNISGVSLLYSGAWTSHYFQSKNITIDNVRIISHGVPHNDGIGIDGCQNVRISNCDIDSGDDALVFKTTSSKMACKNIVVRGMRLKSNQAGIKMGTESMANFENIDISDCHIYDTRNGGIKLLTVDGAHLRGVVISDVTMENVRTPMLFRLGSRLSVFRKDSDEQQVTGTLENVLIRNIKAQAASEAQLTPPSGILITGVPGHYISGLTLENIEISLAGGGSKSDAQAEVPEAVDQYPEIKTFGPKIPAYGVWARHVKELKLRNVVFVLDENELRPALVCEDCLDLEVSDWTIPETTGAESIIRLTKVENVKIEKNKAAGTADSFVKATSGKNIRLKKNTLDERISESLTNY